MPRFPKWRPDAPDFDDGTIPGLVTCRNVYPSAGGYRPFKGLTAATGTLPATWTGGYSFEYNGNTAFLGATSAKLYAHSSGAWVDKLTLATTGPWFFVQFGDLAIGVNGSSVTKYTISTATAAALGGSPPASATMAAVVRSFVFLSGVSSQSMRVYWSAIENAEGWTIGTSQSDIQDIPDGGPITGLSGGEYGVAFQESAISIFEYVGGQTIFTVRKVEDSIGCIAHGSIVRDGQMHYFLSRKGFKAWSPQTGIIHIGENAVDNTFLASYSLSQIRSAIRATVDPDRRLIIWSMADTLWIVKLPDNADAEYSWTQVSIPGLVALTPSVSGSAVTLEGIAAIFPSIEDVAPSLDDSYWGGTGGSKAMVVIKSDGIGYTFSSGSNLEAIFKGQKMELSPGRVTHLRNTRLITDATGGQTLNVDVSNRHGDAQVRVTSADLRANGEMPVRASGRFIQCENIIAAGTAWNYCKGLELEATAGGRL